MSKGKIIDIKEADKIKRKNVIQKILDRASGRRKCPKCGHEFIDK